MQCEQGGAEQTALGHFDGQRWSGGGVTASVNGWGSVCEEVKYPVAECGGDCTECRAVMLFSWCVRSGCRARELASSVLAGDGPERMDAVLRRARGA